MSGKVNKYKRNMGQPAATWVYDEETGWININAFLKNIKKMEKEINARAIKKAN